MEKHKYNIFPEITGEDLERLRADLRGGYDARYPIYTYEGDILDGWNRYRICTEEGIEPVFKEFEGNDIEAIEFVMRTNKRRNLSSSQWAVIAIESDEIVATIKEKAKENQGTRNDITLGKKFPEVDAGRTAERLAQIFNTNDRYIKDVARIKRENPEALNDIRNGRQTISEYKKEEKVKARVEYINKQRQEIAEGVAVLPEGKFEVIVIDPPWNYGGVENYNPETRRVANPYPEMTQQELLGLDIPSADDSIMFLWTTHSFIWDAKELLEKWGFEKKAVLVWDKEKMGMGSWLRMQCEFCVVGIKGKPIWNNTKWRDIIREPRREHSRKPEVFYEMVNDITVGRKLDYFSREQREGWTVYGNDTGKF
jgi:N6-adenosine-specific RNA methylase IME4